MSELLDVLMSQMGGADLGSLIGQLGGQADQKTAEKAVSTGLGAILGGLAGNAKSTGGAEAIFNAVQKKHDGSILDLLGGGGGLGGLLGNLDLADGAKILGHVFGDKQPQVEENIAKNSGLDLSLITKLLPILAPLVMGYLGRKTRESGMGAAGLGDLLGAETQSMGSRMPDLGSLLSMLDQDGDGNPMKEVGGILSKLKDMFGGPKG